MTLTKIFPTVLMTLDFIAALVYLSDGDYRRFIYWCAAGVLTASVTF